MGWRCYEGEARVRNNQNVSRCKLYHETRLSSPLSDEIESELMSGSAQCEHHMRTRGNTLVLSIMVSILTSHTEIDDHSIRYIYRRISKLKYLFNFKDRDEFWHFLCFETILLFCQYWQHKYCGWKQQLFEQIFTEVKEVLLIL